MRYEIGLLRLLVASGESGPAPIQLVARALARSPAQLEEALRFLRDQGLIDAESRPTKSGRLRAATMNAQQLAASVLQMATAVQAFPPPLPILKVPKVAIHHDEVIDVRDSEVHELRGTG